MMLLIGLIGAVPLTVVLYILKANNKKTELDDYYDKLALRSVIVTAIGLLLFVLPMMGVTVLPGYSTSPN